MLLQSFGLKRKVVFQKRKPSIIVASCGKKIYGLPDVIHFFYSPLARRKKGVDAPFPPPPPPPRPLYSSFVPTPPLGGYVAPYFYPVDNGYPSGVTSHSKNSLKTRLKMAQGTPLGLRTKHKKTLVRNLI